MAPKALDRVGAWLERQTIAWRWIDPEAFTQACVELEVWQEWYENEAVEALRDYFEPDDLPAAVHRFLNVASALTDDTLIEFVYDTDDDQTAIPTAIFWTAATAAYDDAGKAFEVRAWRRAIVACLREQA